jgi:uncharacterized membrane protein
MNMFWPVLLIICVILIVAILVLPLPRSRKETSSTAKRPAGRVVFRDDERYWYNGLWYNTPDDPALFVPKRFGLGWTLNFGHAQARLFLITLAGMLLLLGVVVPLLVALLGGGPHPSGCHTLGCKPSEGKQRQ